jgi:hypothetical protein
LLKKPLFGKHTFKHLFLQADVSQATIGLDFLHANSITIDAKNRQVLFPAISPPNPLFPTPVSLPTVPLPVSSVSSHAPDILSILNKFPSVTNPPSTSWPSPEHKTVHSIHTSGLPVFARARRLSTTQLAIAEKTFKELQSFGIVYCSSSPWATPLHMVPKPNAVGALVVIIVSLIMSPYLINIPSKHAGFVFLSS